MFENGIRKIENLTGMKIPYTALRSNELTTTVLFQQIKQTQLLLDQWMGWIDNYLVKWMQDNGLLSNDLDIHTLQNREPNTVYKTFFCLLCLFFFLLLLYLQKKKEKKIARETSRTYDRNSLATDDNYVLFENVNEIAVDSPTDTHPNVDGTNVDTDDCLLM
ncbi:hypothetical protein RFI_00988 [Reticulomyxa filosa]|uniref:Uncharacterized protein n=1 Tax=Reticulomyxa filosa TaxID=46433 RepID=X6PC35_RETFI|nr:hypothetical protein RFI_00988 [Reticulomyxa filosa]|eukprot:ETO36075.1 hypothetical protein RFI_00988 [Reticulomyxa filosa]